MSLIDIQWHPTSRQLRQFAACTLILPLIAWWSGVSFNWTMAIVVASLMLNACAWLAPPLVRPLFIAAMLITLPIGLVVGELALLLIYIGVFLPIGLAFRLIGRDALRLKRRDQPTYWEPRSPRDAKSYLRQY